MKFEEIPEKIRSVLFSERVDGILNEITEKAGIYDTSLLPSVFYGLISKEIPAHSFIEELANTGIGEKIAKSIAKEIKERILEGERYPLFRWGVDISEINVHDAPALEELGLANFLKESAEKTISLETPKEETENIISIPLVSTIKETGEALAVLGKKDKKETENEKTEEKPLILEVKGSENEGIIKERKIIPNLLLGKIGFFKTKKEGVKQDENAPPIKASIFSPFQKEEKRVVHYSENKTELNPWEQNNSFIKESSPIYPVLPPENKEKENKISGGDKSDSDEENKKMPILDLEKKIIDLRGE